MQINIPKVASVSGLAGTTIIVLGSIITASAYEGRAGESYSLLNHFISELGEVGVSELARVFNTCLFTGGLGLTVFLLGLAGYLGGRFGLLYGLVGLVTGVSGSLVGVFPMNNLATHVAVASLFFRMGLVATALFSIYVLFVRQDKFPKWTSIPGVLTVSCFISYLTIGILTLPPGRVLALPAHFKRPDIWLVPLFEWTVFLSVLFWVVVVSLYLYRQQKNLKQPGALG